MPVIPNCLNYELNTKTGNWDCKTCVQPYVFPNKDDHTKCVDQLPNCVEQYYDTQKKKWLCD